MLTFTPRFSRNFGLRLTGWGAVFIMPFVGILWLTVYVTAAICWLCWLMLKWLFVKPYVWLARRAHAEATSRAAIRRNRREIDYVRERDLVDIV